MYYLLALKYIPTILHQIRVYIRENINTKDAVFFQLKYWPIFAVVIYVLFLDNFKFFGRSRFNCNGEQWKLNRMANTAVFTIKVIITFLMRLLNNFLPCVTNNSVDNCIPPAVCALLRKTLENLIYIIKLLGVWALLSTPSRWPVLLRTEFLL